MAKLVLVVKGEMDDASTEISDRRGSIIRMNKHERFEEVICHVEMSWDAAAEWFLDGMNETAPFPAGSLLWFGPLEEKDVGKGA